MPFVEWQLYLTWTHIKDLMLGDLKLEKIANLKKIEMV